MHARAMCDIAQQSVQVLPKIIAVDLAGPRIDVKNAAIREGGIEEPLAQLYRVSLQPRQPQPVRKAGYIGVAQSVTRQRNARCATEIDRDRHAGRVEDGRRAE